MNDGDATMRVSVSIPELASLEATIDERFEQMKVMIGVLVAAVDDVLTKLTELASAQSDEQTQLRDVLSDLRDQVAAGQVDQAKLDSAVSLLDTAIANTQNFVEAAQAAVAETPTNPPAEPPTEG